MNVTKLYRSFTFRTVLRVFGKDVVVANIA